MALPCVMIWGVDESGAFAYALWFFGLAGAGSVMEVLGYVENPIFLKPGMSKAPQKFTIYTSFCVLHNFIQYTTNKS